MNKRLKKSLKGKCIFIDIDGTLAEYRYNGHVSAKDGTVNGQTKKEIEDHVFLHSRPLKTVIKTIRKAKYEGIWIYGAIVSPVELQDKIIWLKKNCKRVHFNGMFWFVPDEHWDSFTKYFAHNSSPDEQNDAGFSFYTRPFIGESDIDTEYGLILKGSKTKMISWIIDHHFIDMEDCVFIDDVLAYIKYAEDHGATAYHISSFIE